MPVIKAACANLKNAVRAPHGWLLRSGISVRRSPPPTPKTIDVLELVVHRYSQNIERPLQLLQVGANDGKTMDPVYGLIRTYGMQVAVVEPIPDVFEQLKKNYADYPYATCINAAIAHSDGHMPLYVLRSLASEAGLDGTLVASFSRQCVVKHQRHFNGENTIEMIRVPTRSLHSLLSQWEKNSFDILQCDVEGFDAEVVNMALDLPQAPPIINFEYIHLDHASRVQVAERLTSEGYSLINRGFDTIAWRES